MEMMLRTLNLWLIGVVALLGGCATHIVPPSAPSNPVAVYVTDYGRHSSILLPMGDGHLMEYSYGDWEYYALNKYKWYIGATKLIVSDASGLGRRILPHPGTDEALQKYINSKRLLRIEIEQSRVLELLAELDHRYNERLDTMVFNNYSHAYFVKDDTHYGLFHTCNAETAGWLRKLGCRVDGLAVLSNFEIDLPKEELAVKPKPQRGIPADNPADPVQLSQQRSQQHTALGQ